MEYFTLDNVFIPSTTELGDITHINTHVIGTVYPFFNGATDDDRIAQIGGEDWNYWTRSPDSTSGSASRIIGGTGVFGLNYAKNHNSGMRPALNLKSDILVSATPNENGAHEIKSVLGNLPVGAKVVDPSWMWEFKTSINYSGTGETKPVTWIVVARDHYGVDSGITLLSEELIAKYTYDNSSDRGGPFGSNHWGLSGTPNATLGLRPWLNSTGNYSGEGFYQPLTPVFKNAIIETILPNKHWQTGVLYTANDKIFIPSTTELGDTTHTDTYVIGTVYPYFHGAINADRIAQISDADWSYWTRSPRANFAPVRSTAGTGYFFNINAYVGSECGVRPSLNLNSDILISAIPNDEGNTN